MRGRGRARVGVVWGGVGFCGCWDDGGMMMVGWELEKEVEGED